MKKRFTIVLSFVLLVICFAGVFSMNVNAADIEEKFAGELFEFEKGSHYEVSEGTSSGNTNTNMGTFSLSGDMKSISDVGGIKAFEVNEGNISMRYSLGSVYANATAENWYLISDKSQKVDGLSLDDDIRKGAVIVQTSLDGKTWVTDNIFTDIANDADYNGLLYISKDIQQVNGCYFRIMVVYELERQTGKNFIGAATHEQKKCAEVYKFYLINSIENSSDSISPTASPRKELGSVVNTGKDNGFSESNPLTSQDPHYGWTIGTFFVNGYTRETTYGNSDSPVFLKNVGDRVTLWFNLQQDITCLNGKSNLQIFEDKNGYDQYFQTNKTNMRHGTLIIRYTDFEGVKHEPVIYTDYLAANARTGANTKVELFEEGDYEVALDYEIVDTTRVDSYTNYRIYFTFSIRNGNCMVYPFDTITGTELSDGAMTGNGFRLDMAKSRYLTIDVQKAVLIENADGTVVEDIRFNRPAKDGDAYTDEGIYTFRVKNLYTGEETTKVIYVGENKVLKALSTNKITIDELNALISGGSTIETDGTIKEPVVEEISEPVPEEEITDDEKQNPTQPTEEPVQPVMEEEVIVEKDSSNGIGIIVAVAVCLVGIAGVGIVYFKKKKSKDAETIIPDPEEEDVK